MAKLIKNGAIVANTWKIVALDPRLAAESASLPYGDLLLPLAVWRARKLDLVLRQWNDTFAGGRLGVWLAPEDDPADIADDLDDLDLVAVHFPTAGDGRGYSIAVLLRTRYGYRGELRAIGAVKRDYLYFLRRVGFDAFEVDDPEEAVGSLAPFSAAYQPVLQLVA